MQLIHLLKFVKAPEVKGASLTLIFFFKKTIFCYFYSCVYTMKAKKGSTFVLHYIFMLLLRFSHWNFEIGVSIMGCD